MRRYLQPARDPATDNSNINRDAIPCQEVKIVA